MKPPSRITAAARVQDESSATPELPAEVMKKSRRAYLLLGFATAPDTGVGPFWLAIILLISQRDEICFSFEGVSSGANGQACTPWQDWNETLWDEAGGEACFVKAGDKYLDVDKYTHDPSLPGCADALDAYRAQVSYTCNCSGDYSKLPSGVRSNALPAWTNPIAIALAAVTLPPLGAYLDLYPSRSKPIWYTLVVGCTVSMFVMAMLRADFIWIGSYVGNVLSFWLGGWMVTVVRQTYLEQTAPNKAGWTQVAAERMATSYCGILAFTVIVVALGFALGDSYDAQQTVALVAVLLCAAWWGGLYLVSIYAMPPRAKQDRDAAAGGVAPTSLCSPFAAMWATLKQMRQNPDSIKYILVIFLAQHGMAGTFINIAPLYAADQLKMTGQKITIVVALIVLCGIPVSFLLRWLVTRVALKKLLLADLCLGVVITAVLPMLNEPGFTTDVFIWLLCGCVASVQFVTYYGVGWPLFLTMAPKDQVGQYSAIFSEVSILGLIIEPFVYAAVVQTTNLKPLAVATMLPWNVAALVLLCFTNTDRGAERAAQLSASGASSCRGQGARSAGGTTAEV